MLFLKGNCRKMNLNPDLSSPRYAPIRRPDMKTAEILNKIDIPRHKLYYLEQKGYVTPKRIPMGDIEAREYSRHEFERIRVIWKYLKQGYKHKTAFQMAVEELKESGSKGR